MKRNVLRHGDDERHFGFDRLLDRAGSLVRSYVDTRRVRLEDLHGLEGIWFVNFSSRSKLLSLPCHTVVEQNP